VGLEAAKLPPGAVEGALEAHFVIRAGPRLPPLRYARRWRTGNAGDAGFRGLPVAGDTLAEWPPREGIRAPLRNPLGL